MRVSSRLHNQSKTPYVEVRQVIHCLKGLKGGNNTLNRLSSNTYIFICYTYIYLFRKTFPHLSRYRLFNPENPIGHEQFPSDFKVNTYTKRVILRLVLRQELY